jgi:hypothetical protein
MDYFEFIDSLTLKSIPEKLPTEALKSLWLAGTGDWEGAHTIAQDMTCNMGSWIHAYLHRQEGDRWNAGYWYDRAGKSFPDCSLDVEYKVLVEAALDMQTD